MNADLPLVSVCVPVYNGERFVEETLRSVLAQTYENWELVIAENRSKDCSLAIIEQFAACTGDPRIRVHVNEQHLGSAPANFNQAIGLARGEFIKVLCADDLLEPDCLARQVQALQAHPGAVLAACAKKIVDANGRYLFSVKALREGLIPGREVVKTCLRTARNLIGEPTMGLIRASALRGMSLMDTQVPCLTDLDFWLRLLLRGDLVFSCEPLASFRVHGQSQTRATEALLTREFFVIAEAVSKELGQPFGLLQRARLAVRLPLQNALRRWIYRRFA